MTIPTNILQNVVTYQKGELAWLLNSFCAISLANKKFVDFEKRTANLGDTISWDLAPRSYTSAGLVVSSFQATDQRVQSLICSQAANSSAAYSDQQFLFNMRDYLDRIGRSRIMELGSFVEEDILKHITGTARVNDPQNPNVGNLVDPRSGPYRFYGSSTAGITNPIGSSAQLATALAYFRDYGAAPADTCGILPMISIPQIINSNATQFTLNRGNKETHDWMVSDFQNCDWYQSNLLPLHESGNVGNALAGGNILTVVSTDDPSGANITQITFSGATPSDPDAIKAGDIAGFIDISGQPNLRYLTFIGHNPSSNPVQIRITADAGSDALGNVTVNIYPALSVTPGQNRNLNYNIVAGNQAAFMPRHRAGVIWSGNPFYLAMPKLPEYTPWPSVSTTDSDSGASIRHYWGSQYGQNTRAYVWDIIYGATLQAENAMRLCFPA